MIMFRRWHAPRWPRERTDCWSRFIPIRIMPRATARRRYVPEQFSEMMQQVRAIAAAIGRTA